MRYRWLKEKASSSSQMCLVYERTGKKSQARREFERVYAEDPSFEDVAQRLGLRISTMA